MNEKKSGAYALISVWNKTGLETIASALASRGYQILSTGGTARYLSSRGIEVTMVEDVTGFPEVLDGRVKTLHPVIHAGILADRKNPKHMDQLAGKNIGPIDFVICNLYPFGDVLEKTLAKKPRLSLSDREELSELIENIDIGGVAILRAASKNYASVVTITDPADYKVMAEKLDAGHDISEEERFRLAVKAFTATARYDTLISSALSAIASAGEDTEEAVESINLFLENIFVPRYGENPHQRAFVYRKAASSLEGPGNSAGRGILGLKQLQGKQLSYNNILDSQVAAELADSFGEPAAVLLKHQIPCGVAIGDNLTDNYRRALASDPVSPFGGIFAFNREVTVELAKELADFFFEVLIAPSVSEEALEILGKKKNLRILTGKPDVSAKWDFRSAGPLILLQESDKLESAVKTEAVTSRKPTEGELHDLLFAYNVCRMVKSNGIVLARNGATAGIGSGQPNRVGALEIALNYRNNMKNPPANFVLASDGFFPFSDSVRIAAENGCTAIIQPGGSIRDSESIEEAEKHGMAMVFTGTRHFRH